ncbi:hypothetical protein B9Z55_007771 [Caenorhabditis nigoni]|nr:hypothetical protein B9Z55_007771 [Caenorhabditis nigoni]
MDANSRIKMSQRIPTIRAAEKSVPLKIRYLSIMDTTVKINYVQYELRVYRDYPNGDIPLDVKKENVRGGVETDFDRFGFEIPIGSNPILPGDISVRNENERVVRTDTDELERRYRNELARCEILLRVIAEKESGLEPKMEDSWRVSEKWGYSKNALQKDADRVREKLKPFDCRRHNLPPPFNCYIQLSATKYLETKPLQRLSYNRKLYEVVKQFNHILFANRPAIKVKVLECRANQVYRTPIGFKISANQLAARQSQIASIATILEGDVNTLEVSRSENAENWWQHRLVQNASELTTDDVMLRAFTNRIIRFHYDRILTAGQYCGLIENWMSVKREVGSELRIVLSIERDRKYFLDMIQTRMKVVRRDERCVTIHDKNGTQIEVSLVNNWWVKVEVVEN